MIGASAFWLLYTLQIIRGDLTVIDCLLIVVLLETAIQSGLIPVNTSYRELFEKTTVPVIIVDDNLQARYTSGGALPVSYEAMCSAQSGSVVIGNTMLSLAEIRAGKVLWQDDVTRLNEQRKELDEMREELSEEAELIRAETEIKEKQAQADEKNRLYDKIAREVREKLDILDGLISKVEAGEMVKENLARVAVIGSYVKRRGNMLLVANKSEKLQFRELENALRESLENLKLLKVDATIIAVGSGWIALHETLKAYDLYESVIEGILDGISAIFVRVTENKLSIQIGMHEGVSTERIEGLSNGEDVVVEVEENDVYIDLKLGEL